MSKEIAHLREAIKAIVPIIAGKGLRVTQVGSQAYVSVNKRTGLPEVVNIPSIPDNAEPAFVAAIQGFIDHEVAHVLFTELGYKIDAPQRLHHIHNIVEDTMIERLMGQKFPGSRKNIARLRAHFIAKITKPALARARDPREQFGILLVPLMRALAGHVEFQEFLEDEGHYEHPLIKAFLAALSPETIKSLPTLTTTRQTYVVAEEIEKILHPPEEPKKGKPKKEKEEPGEGEKGEGDKSEEKDEKPGKDGKGKGEKEHDEETGSDEASGGESDEDAEVDDEGYDGKGGEGDEETDEEEGKPGKSKDKKEDDDSAGAGDQEDEDEVTDTGSGDPESSDDDDAEADDGDASGSSEDPEEDSDEGDGEGSGGKGSDDGDDEAGSDAGSEDDDSEGEGDSGEDGPGEADGEGDDEGEGSDDSSADGHSESGKGEAGAPKDGAHGDYEAPDDDGDASDLTIEDEEGDEEEAPSAFHDYDESYTGGDISSEMSKLIAEDMRRMMAHSPYNVFTRDFDVIEPFRMPEYFNRDLIAPLDEQTRKMTSVMRKDIERMMAAQARVFNYGGQRSGRLNGPALHKITAGDGRLFTKREEIRAKDTAVSLLIDCSGSMRGTKMATAATAAYAMATTLEAVNIPCEVLGFTAAWGHMSSPISPRVLNKVRSMFQEDARKTGVQYHRVDPLYISILKEWHERLGADQKARFAALRSEQEHLCENVDGESLDIAAQRISMRKEKRKVILVFSDGAPSAGYLAKNLDIHLRQVAKRVQASGIDLVGIGIEDRNVERFYDNSIVLRSANELPAAVMNELKKILTK
jgi:cobalamin biosynthesis protein CobT